MNLKSKNHQDHFCFLFKQEIYSSLLIFFSLASVLEGDFLFVGIFSFFGDTLIYFLLFSFSSLILVDSIFFFYSFMSFQGCSVFRFISDCFFFFSSAVWGESSNVLSLVPIHPLAFSRSLLMVSMSIRARVLLLKGESIAGNSGR